MKSYKKPHYKQGGMKINTATRGESIETKIERIVNNKEPIKDGAPIIFTERKEGVRASHNIRTDRWEVAVDATTTIQKSYKARREEQANKRKQGQGDGKPESTQGKGDTPTENPTK